MTDKESNWCVIMSFYNASLKFWLLPLLPFSVTLTSFTIFLFWQIRFSARFFPQDATSISYDLSYDRWFGKGLNKQLLLHIIFHKVLSHRRFLVHHFSIVDLRLDADYGFWVFQICLNNFHNFCFSPSAFRLPQGRLRVVKTHMWQDSFHLLLSDLHIPLVDTSW